MIHAVTKANRHLYCVQLWDLFAVRRTAGRQAQARDPICIPPLAASEDDTVYMMALDGQERLLAAVRVAPGSRGRLLCSPLVATPYLDEVPNGLARAAEVRAAAREYARLADEDPPPGRTWPATRLFYEVDDEDMAAHGRLSAIQREVDIARSFVAPARRNLPLPQPEDVAAIAALFERHDAGAARRRRGRWPAPRAHFHALALH